MPRSPRGLVRVGGRVLRAEPRLLLVADALAALEVSLAETVEVRAGRGAEQGVAPGDLVVVEGRVRAGKLERARLVGRFPGREPSGESEFGRLALDGVGRHLAARALAFRVVRDWFDAAGFVEVDTPIRVPSPGLDAHVDAVRAGDEWLITSPELQMKRLLVGGLPRLYQIVHTTRAGELGPLHEPEFTMLEWYRAFSGIEAVIADTEEIVAAVAHAIARGTRVRSSAGRSVELTPPFPRLTVREAYRRHAHVSDAVDLASTDEDRYFQIFVDQVEPALARSRRPVVLCEFPITQAALARPCPHDPSVAERFEIYAGGVELCNGFGELTDAAEQRRRFVAEHARRLAVGAPLHPIDERFLDALNEGLPPSGGNALGLDRLLALCLGLPEISAGLPFPSKRLRAGK